MKDFSGNEVEVGEQVIVLTNPHSGGKYKRLFHAEVIEVSENKCKVICFENNREVSLTSNSVVKMYQGEINEQNGIQ